MSFTESIQASSSHKVNDVGDVLDTSSSREETSDLSSDLVSVCHYVYDDVDSDLKQSKYSLMNDMCKPCDPQFQKICRYGPCDCLY